jgi:hypothetical protein
VGYYTTFDLIEPEFTDEMHEKLKEIAGYEISFGESIKWYDWKDHMAKLSVHYPDKEFVMFGAGEEDNDRWKVKFSNGEMDLCSAEIVYPEFDDSHYVRVCDPLPVAAPERIPEPIEMNEVKDAIDWDF